MRLVTLGNVLLVALVVCAIESVGFLVARSTGLVGEVVVALLVGAAVVAFPPLRLRAPLSREPLTDDLEPR